MLHASGRGKYIVATDEDCLRAFVLITQKEGILPGKLPELSRLLLTHC